MSLISVWTTVATMDDARRIAAFCIEKRLAACVQLSRIESFYEWEGRVQQDDEVRIVCKTTGDRCAALEAALRAEHPYDLPAIFAFDVARASEPYARWVRESVE